MLDKVLEYIKRHNLVPASTRRIFVAVSGGVDSVVLLDVLKRLQPKFKYELQVVHFNHQIRGSASKADEKFVEKLAAQYGLRFQSGRLRDDVKNTSETFLRDQRFKFFSRLVEPHKDALIATGHNQNDNIETFVMRLARGSRLRGLTGIQPKRGQFIRPLLGITREEIVAYALRHQIRFREDQTNSDTRILRNKIRHDVLPFLQRELEPDLMNNLMRVMEDLGEHRSIFDQKLEEAIAHATRRTKAGISVHRKRYLKFSRVIRRGLIEYCISTVYPLNYSISDRSLQAWDGYIADALPGKKMTFLENGQAFAERHYIVFGEVPEHRKEKYWLVAGKSLLIHNRYRISLASVDRSEVEFHSDKNVEYIDGDKSGTVLIVRFWQQGDAFRPLGMRNFRKLSDFFIDLKVSKLVKKEIPIVCRDERIIWVAGYRLDDSFKVSADTKNVLRLKLEQVAAG
jgi:tRNA(Ile)-lysidine synthase